LDISYFRPSYVRVKIFAETGSLEDFIVTLGPLLYFGRRDPKNSIHQLSFCRDFYHGSLQTQVEEFLREADFVARFDQFLAFLVVIERLY